MSTKTATANITPTTPGVSSSTALLLATACGVVVANIYYAQPLVGPIADSLGLSLAAAGLIVTLTQLGYVIGLLLIVPLGDVTENRRLVLVLTGLSALALCGAALSTSPLPFLVAAFFIGVGSVAVQVVVTYAAQLATDATRGQIVGNVLGGGMLGIMLARPVASFVTELSSWHVVFFGSAVVMLLLALVLWRALPQFVPTTELRYRELLASMGRLARTTPVLQRRALYHACLFGAFSIFWTTIPLLLAEAFGLSQGGIALFALAGVAGAVAAPLAGRLADNGWTRPATVAAISSAVLSFLLTHFSSLSGSAGLALLVVAAVLLDAAVTTNLVLSQRAIFSLSAEHRGRLNGLFLATFFFGGAAGSAVGGWAYARGGWALTSWLGLALPLVALVFYGAELARGRAKENPAA